MTDQKTPDTFQTAAGTARLAAEAGSSLGLVGEKGTPWDEDLGSDPAAALWLGSQQLGWAGSPSRGRRRGLAGGLPFKSYGAPPTASSHCPSPPAAGLPPSIGSHRAALPVSWPCLLQVQCR